MRAQFHASPFQQLGASRQQLFGITAITHQQPLGEHSRAGAVIDGIVSALPIEVEKHPEIAP